MRLSELNEPAQTAERGTYPTNKRRPKFVKRLDQAHSLLGQDAGARGAGGEITQTSGTPSKPRHRRFFGTTIPSHP
jgi:hypothetical protein